jgi:hypothetical protein
MAIGLHHLIGVARPQHRHARYGAQRDELLHRLMGRPILAVAHGVMGEDHDGRQLHQGREADGGPRVVAEDEEGRAEGPELRQRHAVHGGRHGMLADAEMQVAPLRLAGLEIARAGEFQGRLVRGAEIGRAAEEPGNVLGQHVQHLTRGVASGDPLGSALKLGQVAVPAGRQIAALHLLDLGGERRELGLVVGEELVPGGMAAAPRAPMPAAK